jgi:hypothetical protein
MFMCLCALPVLVCSSCARHLASSVLADYTRLLSDVVQRCGQDCAHSPVVTFGGSLAGTLAALMRLRAPWLVDMAWASSSPLLGFDGMAGISQYAWRERITTNWRELAAPPDRGGGHPTGEACVRAVRAGFAALQAAAPNASRVAQAFNVCEGTSSDDVAARIEGLAWGILEGEGTHSYPPALSHIPGRCRAMLAAAADATRAASRAAEGRNASSAADVLATDGVAPPGGSAEDAGLGIFKALLEWRPSPSPPKCLNMSSGGGPSRNGVAWDYLACTEVLHPIGSNNVTDFFPPSPWAVPLIADQCRNEFAPVLTPRPHWLPTQFGLYDRRRFARAASRILFTYGSRDPWATLGVGFSSLSPTLPVLAIPNGSHCADMTGDRPTDTPQMLEARQKAFALLTGWIRAHAATKHEN